MSEQEFVALGKTVRQPSRQLEVFPRPSYVEMVALESDELTSLCPVTGQPDFSVVLVEYAPNEYCIESKSFKLYLWSYREEGEFCEALAAKIASDIDAACQPHWCKVTVVQKPRGGVKITATARRERP